MIFILRRLDFILWVNRLVFWKNYFDDCIEKLLVRGESKFEGGRYVLVVDLFYRSDLGFLWR